MKADEFPSIGAFDVDVKFGIAKETLADLLESTHFAMAHQDVRYYLNGLLLEMESHRIRAVATDGHRLALTDKAIELELEAPKQYILPRKGVLEISRLLNVAEERVVVTIGENHLRVDAGSQSLTTKLIDGRFPDYERVIPRESGHAIVADREILRAGLGRASILSNEKFRGIRLIFKEGLLTATAHNPEQEEAEEEIEIEYSGEAMEVGFNVSYLLDVLGVMRSDTVRIDLIDANSSCLMRGSRRRQLSIRGYAHAALILADLNGWAEIGANVESMRFESITISNLRCLEHIAFAPGAGTSLICGANGTGKTSLLEGFALASVGKSFLSNRSQDIVRAGAPGLSVHAALRDEEARPFAVAVRKSKGETTISLDGLPIMAASSLAQKVPMVVINSKAADILTENPSNRRALIDRTMFHVEPANVDTWKQYRQALRQCNELIRCQAPARQATFWNDRLSDSACR